MTNSHCPACNAPIGVDDINMAEGVGLCRACNTLHRLSDLIEGDEALCDQVARSEPPRGAWLRDDGVVTRIGAVTRSRLIGGFMWCFTLFWNGVVSVFLYIAITAVLVHAGLLPESRLVPMSQNSGPSKPLDVGGTIFLCVFLIPFVLIGIGTFLLALVATFGSTEVRLRGNDASVRTGLGPIMLKKTFEVAEVKSVRLGNSDISQNNQPLQGIIVKAADRKIVFGALLSSERRRWMASVLRELVLPTHRRKA